MANEELKIRNMEMVMETTYQLVLRYGIENTTKEMQVRATGISRSTLDRYFPCKKDCMLQLAQWAAERLSLRMAALSDKLSAGKYTGAEQLRLCLEGLRELYFEQRELFLAIVELRVFINRNCEDSMQVFDRLSETLGYRPLLCKVLERGKADGTLLPTIDVREEAGYINGFYREMLVSLALARNCPVEEQTRVIEGFIDRLIRYYSVPDDRHA